MIINGMPVYVATDQYRSNFVLSDNVKVSNEFRKSFQLWLDEFFGKTVINIVPTDMCIVSGGTIICSSLVYSKLLNATDQTRSTSINKKNIFTQEEK